MRTVVGLAVLAALAPPAVAAAPTDLSELFPANSPFYFEFRRPDALATELGAAFRGTLLEDSLTTVSRFRERRTKPMQPPADLSPVGFIGSLLGPEMLAEIKRFGGFAVGVTGFTRAGEPSVAAVLATGDSHLPGLVLRAYLTASQGMRKIDWVDGVDLYQEVASPEAPEQDGPVAVPPNGVPGIGEPVPFGPVYAYTPGCVIVSTDKAAAAAVVRRWKGKDRADGSALSGSLKSFSELRRSALAFAYAGPKQWANPKDGPGRKANRTIDPPGRAIAGELLSPGSVSAIGVGWVVDREAYVLRCEARLEPGRPSPLFDLVGAAPPNGQPAATGPEGVLRLSVSLGARADRGERLVRFADAIARGAGTLGITPGEAVDELARKENVNLKAEFLDKVSGITTLLPVPEQWPREGWPWPTIVFRCDDAAAAAAAERALPPLLRLAGATSTDPTVETVSGVRILSITGEGLNGPAVIHFAARGTDFGVGAERTLLAATLASPTKPAAETPDPERDNSVLLSAPWRSFLPRLLGTAPPAPAVRGQRGDGPGTAATPEANPAAALQNALDAMVRALVALPPVVGTLRRDGVVVRAELRQPDGRASCRKVADRCVEWAGKWLEVNGGISMSPGVTTGPVGAPVER